MSKQLDDSGYVSNSITLLESLSLDCSSINENSNLQTTDGLNNRTYELRRKNRPENGGTLCVTKNSKIKLQGVTYTSTPYSKSVVNDDQCDIKVNQPSCSFLNASYVTPNSRKRKKCWNEFDSLDCCQVPYVNENHDLDVNTNLLSLNRHEYLKKNCTRKLLTDFSDGSLSDTDLEKKKKIRLEGTRSEPNSPGRNQSILSSPFNNSKLGLAEKNEMLYPQLRHRARPRKYNISTPQKIRQEVKDELLKANIPDICKPSQTISNFIHSSKKVDFFTLFTEVSNNFHIIQSILSYLEPKDLESVYNVSKRARCCIKEIPQINHLLKNYLRHKKINKENFVTTSSLHETSALNCSSLSLNNSIDGKNVNKQLKNNNSMTKAQVTYRTYPSELKTSPRKREWLKFVEASADLIPGQKLTRCGRCSNPAKVLDNIILCTRRSCQFICCSKCCNPFCDSVQYLEKFSDIENMPKSTEFLNNLPPCSNSEDGQLQRRPNNRLFLAECSNSNIRRELSFTYASTSNINNNNNRIDSCDNTLSNIFNFSILDNSSRSPNNTFGNDRYKRNHNIDNNNLMYVAPESPPKINKPIPINSKSSKKNLRRL